MDLVIWQCVLVCIPVDNTLLFLKICLNKQNLGKKIQKF